MHLLVLFVATMLTVTYAFVLDKDCRTYMKFDAHTMCKYKAKTCSTGNEIIKRGLTKEEINSIVNIHNKLRKKLVKGEIKNQPKAKKMKPITWDVELAKIAQRAADQCEFEHDTMRDVERFSVGQNIYMSGSSTVSRNQGPNMTAAALAWWNEVYEPGFDSNNIKPFVFDSGAGHYTQMAWADTTEIGCGYVMFKPKTGTSSTKHVFCNYGPAGNMADDEMYEVVE